MLFAFGITSALVARDRTGAGQRVDVSLLGSMIAFQGRQITRFLSTGAQGRARFRRSPVYSHYRAVDGWVAIAAQDPKRWGPLCRALDRPDLEHDPRFAGPWDRHAHAEALEDELEAAFAQRPVAAWLERLISEDVPCGPVHDYRALVGDDGLPAQLDANGYLATVDHPNLGRIRTAGIPIQLSATPAPPVRPAPELGQHTEEVLLDLGYTWEQIEQLKIDAII
ncbi:MAG: CoA transferase [Chloroflexi bacterium]|nr:CoA transferase [Chloroflexota bacterium]